METTTFETIGKAYIALQSKLHCISVDNSNSQSFNINIDYPSFHCFAQNKAEAIGKMWLSDFQYKHLKIHSINIEDL
jgi:hypothetical protein